MSREKKPRISTEAAAAAWQPFADLEIGGLPDAPPASTPVPAPAKKKSRGRLILRRSTAHRGGKVVTVVDELPTHLHPKEVEDLARLLRQRCSTGGTVRDRKIEVQGDRVAEVRALLEAEGFRVDGER